MPELPEVETTRRGISPHIKGKKVTDVLVRDARLRWPIPQDLKKQLQNKTVRQVQRRAKYLLIQFDHGCLIMHLGMSGNLRIVKTNKAAAKHDHLDIVFGSQCLRFHDPRRFGAVLWTDADPFEHKLLAQLGPEPLSEAFTGEYLYQQAKRRKIPVKQFLMDGRVVVGVGNIYANESLFLAGIHPLRACHRISQRRLLSLVTHVKAVLERAIKQGGTTLKDFVREDGQPGYFQQSLKVYGRGNQPCLRCGTLLKERRIGQRSTVYCPGCQS